MPIPDAPPEIGPIEPIEPVHEGLHFDPALAAALKAEALLALAAIEAKMHDAIGDGAMCALRSALHLALDIIERCIKDTN